MKPHSASSAHLEQILLRLVPTALLQGDVSVALQCHDADGDTALHRACLSGDYEGVETLIAAGAGINARGDMDCSPLYYAVSQDHTEIAALLLAHGADPDLRCLLGTSARALALRSGNTEMIDLFLGYKKRRKRQVA